LFPSQRIKSFFREETLGKVIVMGRKTLESLPGKQPLYGRTNIVLTRNPDYKVKGAVVCHSLSEVLEELGKYPEEDCFIIGGQSIYEQFLPYCNTAHCDLYRLYVQCRYPFPQSGPGSIMGNGGGKR
jgi:dihydrofolate reductase